MENFLEMIKPYADIIIYVVLAVGGFVWQNIKGRIKDATIEAVTETEKAFSGAHNKSKEKKEFAINYICSKFPFISKKAAEEMIDFALEKAQQYALAEANKLMDEIKDAAMGGKHDEEISD